MMTYDKIGAVVDTDLIIAGLVATMESIEMFGSGARRASGLWTTTTTYPLPTKDTKRGW